jgi:hypothetical protein
VLPGGDGACRGVDPCVCGTGVGGDLLREEDGKRLEQLHRVLHSLQHHGLPYEAGCHDAVGVKWGGRSQGTRPERGDLESTGNP